MTHQVNSLENRYNTDMFTLSASNFTFQNLIKLCAQFGVKTLPFGHPEQSNLRISRPGSFQQLADLNNSMDMQADQTNPNPNDNTSVYYALTNPFVDWGILQTEAGYHEDLVYSFQKHSQNHLVRLESPVDTKASSASPLQNLAFDIRNLLGDRDWLIYWGQNKQEIYLLALYPSGWSWQPTTWQTCSQLTTPKLLSPLSIQVMQSALDEWRERLSPDRLDAEDSDYAWFEMLAGHMIFAPTQLNRLLSNNSKPGLNPAVLLNMGTLWPFKIQKIRQKIWETFLIPHTKLEGYLTQWQEIYRLCLPFYLEISHFINPWCQLLDEHNVLNTYLQTFPNKVQNIERKLFALKEQIDRMSEHQESEELGTRDILRNPEFKSNWQLFISDFGHLSPSALDLAHPRFQEYPEQLLRQLRYDWQEHHRAEDWGIKHWLWLPIWKLISRLLLCQEELLSDALWALDQIRQRIRDHGNQLSQQQLIQDSDQVWWHISSELNHLKTKNEFHYNTEKRQHLYQQWQELLTKQKLQNQPDHLPTMKGLKFGLAQGKIWWYQSSQSMLPEDVADDDIILVIQNLDLGWIPFIKRCQGIILTACGPYDPAALLLRQMGVPSLICHDLNVIPEAETEVRLNSDTGNLTLISPIN